MNVRALFRRTDRRLPAAVLTAAACVPALAAGAAGGRPASSPAPPTRVSPAEGRRMVRMMDDIYMAAVLTTHRMYVQDPGTPAAVIWAKQVINQIKGKGWPEARIFAAVDRPLNPENNPVDAFERQAVQEFRAGKASLERSEPGTLRYATPIRLADKSCLTCHVRGKVGDLVGGVSYRVLVNDQPAAPR